MFQTKRATTPEAEEILGGYFPVLDHGFVSLVDYMGNDEAAERAARVSYGAVPKSKQSTTEGLLRFMKGHGHSSPFEMIELKFHCRMPIFVARQWVRTRTANLNEVSGRYSKIPMVFHMPDNAQVQDQSKENKQGRMGEPISADRYEQMTLRFKASRAETASHYDQLIEDGIAKELARIDLPLSTYTEWYWKIDLHNLMHFLKLRVDSHAQWEFQQYGQVIAGMVKRVCPISFQAWIDYDHAGARFSRVELELLQLILKGSDEDVLGFSKLSKREIAEFYTKTGPVPMVRDFSLDLSTMKDASFFDPEVKR